MALPLYAIALGGMAMVKIVQAIKGKKELANKSGRHHAPNASSPNQKTRAVVIPDREDKLSSSSLSATPLVSKNAAAARVEKKKLGLVKTLKHFKGYHLSGTRRGRQLREMAGGQHEESPELIAANKMVKQSLTLTSSMLLSAFFYPPLLLWHIPFLAYVSRPLYNEAIDDLHNKKVSTAVVDAAISVGTMAYSRFNPFLLGICGVGGIIYSYTRRLTALVKDTSSMSFTNLMGDHPKTIWKLVDQEEIEVPFDSARIGDQIVFSAGEMISMDGTILEGLATIDQQSLTGEAQPADKGKKDPVLAGTIVLSGRIVVAVEKMGEDTTAAQIGQMLMKTANFTSSVELRGKEISDDASGPTLLLSLAFLPVIGANRAIALLYSGVGYNMRALGPLTVFNFLELAADKGILIKDGRALEQIGKLDTIVFDKTGTLTREQPHVIAIHTCQGIDEDQLLTFAATAEYKQSHPVARAILLEAERRGLDLPDIDDVTYELGYGIKVRLDGVMVRVGSNRFVQMEGIEFPEETVYAIDGAHDKGNTLIFVAFDDQLAGVIELEPTIRPEAARIIEELHLAGLKTVIISGDHERPTRALATALGIDACFAEALPADKADIISELQKDGCSVGYVGDGINDTIALKKANVSVSLRGATTAATDTAQIILMDGSLNSLVDLLDLSWKFESSMNKSLMTTIIPGFIIIGGSLVGALGYISSMLLFFGGMVVGVLNAMSPRAELLDNEPRTAGNPDPLSRKS